MGDLNTALLAVVLAISTLVLWSIRKMTWDTARIANRIDQKTDEVLKYAELNLEATREVLRELRKKG